jgi:hypothetical protein
MYHLENYEQKIKEKYGNTDDTANVNSKIHNHSQVS